MNIIRTTDENCAELVACEVVLRQADGFVGFATREQYAVWQQQQEAAATAKRLDELFAGL